MNFSPLALVLLSKTTQSGSIVARQILMDFEQYKENYGPITRSSLPLDATTIKKDVMGKNSRLQITYNKPENDKEYVDISISGEIGSYARQTLQIAKEMPATLIDGYKNKKRMLSEVTMLPGFETMKIVKITTKPKTSGNQEIIFEAEPPMVTQHSIEKVLKRHSPEDNQNMNAFDEKLYPEIFEIVEEIQKEIPNIKQILDPLLKYALNNNNRSSAEMVRITPSWSISFKNSVKFTSDKFKRTNSKAAIKSAVSEIIEAVKKSVR